MPEAGLTELLQAGVHFGHQTRRWNPNMRRFIFGELDGIHILDLLQTEAMLQNARRFAGELASGGRTAVFVTRLKTEEIAVHEAARLRIPIIGLVDTNCDPTPVDFVIPGNDDAIRSCQLIIGTIGGAVEKGSSAWRVQEEKRIAEEMARRKKDEEERKKREEEEKVRLEAEAAAKAAAEAEAQAK